MLSVFIFSLIIFGVQGIPENGSAKPDSEDDWNLMVLTRTWPPAACIYLANMKRTCNVSRDVHSWVIHGLWPTKTGSEGPNFCNKTWKFDISKVQSLRPTLDYNWPALIKGERPEDSWKHEWEKHGTCGASLPAIKDELHYFNVTLYLHKHYNLTNLLTAGGIIPSQSRGYKAKDIWTILHESLQVAPNIYCVRDKKDGKYYLEQTEICLSRSFVPVNCTNRFSARRSHSDLHFKSEASILRSSGWEKILRDNIQDCGSESDDVYLKPTP